VARVPIVAVVGHGTVSEGTGAWRLAEVLAERLVDARYRVLMEDWRNTPLRAAASKARLVAGRAAS